MGLLRRHSHVVLLNFIYFKGQFTLINIPQNINAPELAQLIFIQKNI